MQEANAESKYLNGLGIARERKAIVEGLKGSVEEFSHNVEGTSPKDVMDLILLTQYFGESSPSHKRKVVRWGWMF